MDLGVDISTQLFPNPFTMLYTLCVTAVLFYFVYKFLFNPVRDYISKRQTFMENEINEAKQTNLKASESLKLAQDEVEKAQSLSKEIIANAKKEALDNKDKIILEANDKASDIYRRANERIAKEEKELRRDLNQQIVDVALEANKKLLGTKDLENEDVKALDDFVKELNHE